MAVDSEGNLEVYQDSNENIKEKHKSKENSLEYNQLEQDFKKLCSESQNNQITNEEYACWKLFYPIHEYFFWIESIKSFEERKNEDKEKWPEFADHYERIGNRMIEFFNKHVSLEYNRPSVLKNHSAIIVKGFAIKHKKDLGSFLEKIADWPEEKFVAWGCKKI